MLDRKVHQPPTQKYGCYGIRNEHTGSGDPVSMGEATARYFCTNMVVAVILFSLAKVV